MRSVLLIISEPESAPSFTELGLTCEEIDRHVASGALVFAAESPRNVSTRHESPTQGFQDARGGPHPGPFDRPRSDHLV